MNDQEIRYECLRLANAYDGSPREIVERARAYADFILGTHDAEIIRAANDLAATVSGASSPDMRPSRSGS